MFQKNEVIRYGAHGVCRIQEVTEKNLNGALVEYYVLRPVYNDTSTLYVPAHNPALTNQMQRILSEAEVKALIHSMPQEETAWIDNEEARKGRYQRILADGDRLELVRMIKALYFHQQELRSKGRKLHISDDRFFKDAEKMLYEEFALVLQIEKEEVLPFILELLSNEDQKNCG